LHSIGYPVNCLVGEIFGMAKASRNQDIDQSGPNVFVGAPGRLTVIGIQPFQERFEGFLSDGQLSSVGNYCGCD
jgi:hypothetical protein